MTDKKSVLLYCDIIHTVEELTDDEAGRLFKHYLRYINDQNPEVPDKITKIVFEPIKQNLKRDLKKWELKSERNSNIAKAMWAERKDANASERMQSDVVKVTVKVKDIVSLKVQKLKTGIFEILKKVRSEIPDTLLESEAGALISKFPKTELPNDVNLVLSWAKKIKYIKPANPATEFDRIQKLNNEKYGTK